MSHAITDKILEDARNIAKSTAEEGAAKAVETIAEAQNDADIYLSKHREETAALVADVFRRKKSMALLEVKKTLLKAKKDLIDAVFSKAVEELIEDKAAYLSLIEGMLQYAANGDKVYISARDKKTVTKAFIDSYAKARGIKLTLAKENAEILGGIILSSGSVDKNLSLDVEMQDVKNSLEAQIANMLFGAAE